MTTPGACRPWWGLSATSGKAPEVLTASWSSPTTEALRPLRAETAYTEPGAAQQPVWIRGGGGGLGTAWGAGDGNYNSPHFHSEGPGAARLREPDAQWGDSERWPAACLSPTLTLEGSREGL